MKKTFFTFYFLLIAVICTAQTYSFTYQGQSRNYIVHLPTGFTQGQHLPLVFNFHGYTSNASQQESYTQFDAVADTAKFIVVYPNGISNAWNAGIGLDPTIDDVGFVSVLIDTLHKNFGIDLCRVYATGFSNGGFLCHRLACELSDRFAAIASVSGTIGTSTSTFICNPSRIVPVMHIHGTSDATVSYTGTTYATSVDSTIHFWVDRDICPATVDSTNLPNTNTSDGSTVTKFHYGLCQDSSEVILLKIYGGSHSWPGAIGLSGTNMDIKASGVIWTFFRNHHLPCAITSIDNLSSNEEPITILQNPINEKITLKINSSRISQVTMYTILGSKIFETKNMNGFDKSFYEINSSDFPNGTYLLNIKTDNRYYNYKIIKL
jgi:polyhydroxybutyrate depolymerase